MRLHVSVASIEGVIELFTRYCFHIEECEITVPLSVHLHLFLRRVSSLRSYTAPRKIWTKKADDSASGLVVGETPRCARRMLASSPNDP